MKTHSVFIKTFFFYFSTVFVEKNANNSQPYTIISNGSERVFRRFASCVSKIPPGPPRYSPVANVLGLSSPVERKRAAGIRFVGEGHLDGKIDQFSRHLSDSAIRTSYAPRAATNYSANGPLRGLTWTLSSSLRVRFFLFPTQLGVI